MILKLGSKGEEVKKLQSFLGQPPTGNFDAKLESAVKIWQKRNGLKDDGIAGPITLSKMKLFENETSLVVNSSSLNLAALKGLVPDSVIAQLPDTAAKFNITTNLRLAHFLAQCATESGKFTLVVENLNYSANLLNKLFSRYFPGNLADLYAHQPIKIGSRIYGGRMGNGDEKSREGYTYRGRGYIQLTGKNNYTAFSKFIGKDCVENPDLVSTVYPLASAAFFFNSNNLWSICDQGAGEDTVTLVSKRVNGGTNGLEERKAYFKKFWAALNK